MIKWDLGLEVQLDWNPNSYDKWSEDGLESKELNDKKCDQKGEKRHKMKFLQDMGTNFFYSVGIKFFEDVGTKFFQDVGRGPPNGRRRQSDDRDD